ncbi:MAG: hypothetical protein JXA14_00440 [Anaerolineae bacterium]|nr:hypothetical protein [Anaerolineae bacterium]
MKSQARNLTLVLSLVGAVGLLTLAMLACGTATPPGISPTASSLVGSTDGPPVEESTPMSGFVQPASPADYPAVIREYLNAGGDVATLEGTLAEWGALQPEFPGQVVAVDLTGDDRAEIVVALWYVGDAVAPSGDLLIFVQQDGSYVLLYREGYDPSGPAVRLLQVIDANGDGRRDVIYTLGTCGAHTCFESLEVLSWQETGFFSLMGGRLDMPYPTYAVTPGRIDAESGSVASVGAEPQRGYSEVWEWNGSVFTVTQQVWAPPVYRYHALLDGDYALFAGDYAAAVVAYERAIGDDALQEWGAVSGGVDPEVERAQLTAFVRWRLVLTYLQAGDLGSAQVAYEQLQAGYPADAVGHDVAALAEVFWEMYAVDGSIVDGCTVLVVAAKQDTSVHDFFNANYGYANPRWEAVDICPFIE